MDLTSDSFLQDILKSAGDKGFNCLAEKVLELFGTGAVEVKSLLMGLCRRVAVHNLDVAKDCEIEQLRCENVALDADNGAAWDKAISWKKSLEDLQDDLELESRPGNNYKPTGHLRFQQNSYCETR